MITPDIIDATTPPREGMPLVERTVVQCIVRHAFKDLYLLLEKVSWDTSLRSFVTGGIEEGEDPVQSGVRELAEEAGYTNTVGATEIGEPYGVQFYHESKKKNRRAIVHTIAARLADMTQVEVAEEEKAQNRPIWVPADEVIQTVHGEGCKRVFKQYLAAQQEK